MKVYSGKSRDKGQEFKQKRFQLDIREKQFPVSISKHWKRGPERWGNFCPCRLSRPDWKKP